MVTNPPPIQEKPMNQETGLFPQVWIRWFLKISAVIDDLASGGVLTVNGISPDGSGNAEVNASDIDYDNTTSGIAATNVQDALDEINRGNGIADYNDTSTTASPVTLVADTWTTIPNNGAGAFTNLSYLPSGVTDLMDTSTGALDFSELDLGDNVVIRNDYTINPSTNDALLKFRYTLGAVGSEYTLEKTIGRLDSGSGIDYRFSLTTDMIYMGDTNTKDNPIGLQVNLSTDGTLVNAGTSLGVTKR